jgi:hypothetical protein
MIRGTTVDFCFKDYIPLRCSLQVRVSTVSQTGFWLKCDVPVSLLSVTFLIYNWVGVNWRFVLQMVDSAKDKGATVELVKRKCSVLS